MFSLTSLAKVSTFLLFSLLSSGLLASDYYFRPLEASHTQNWTPDLEFQVVNSSDKSILIKVSVRPKYKKISASANDIVPLQALPASLLMRPGTHRRIRLNYDALKPHVGEEEFEILVEQVPVFFSSPGSYSPPDLMTVTNYIADVKVRTGRTGTQVFAEAALPTNVDAPSR